MKSVIKFIFLLLIVQFSLGQSNTLPQDYLPIEFHKSRREALRSKLSKNTVAVFFSNPTRNRSNDVDYLYHQDPDFYYLSGYKEPHSVLLIFSEDQTDESGHSYDELLFVQPKNATAEMWNGERLGVKGAEAKLNISKVLANIDFRNSFEELVADKTIFIKPFSEDVRDFSKTNDLYSLMNDFKDIINYDIKHVITPEKSRVFELIQSTTVENNASVAQILGRAVTYYPELKNEPIVNAYIKASSYEDRDLLKHHVIEILDNNPLKNLDITSLSEHMAALRQIKTKEELVLLKKAIEISAIGQIEVMKAIKPSMSELEIQGIHEYVYKKYGSEYEGYNSIVGSGNNGCILHYVDNAKTSVHKELVLMDLGAEYHGYTADVTRTIPSNGKFTKDQRLVYDLVYEAQEAGIKSAVVGNSFNSPDAAARKVITKGLIDLGIAKNEEDTRQYFPHGTSHYLGLDVHDPGLYGDFEANMVITVEPGIYVPEGSPCDKKWWGIAVRIEDDILITEHGPVNLSAKAPRTSKGIEKMMKLPSALNDFVLPVLD